MKTRIGVSESVGKTVAATGLESDVCFISFTDGTYITLVPGGYEDCRVIEEADDDLNVMTIDYRVAAATAEVITNDEYDAYARKEREERERNQRAHDERELKRIAQKLGVRLPDNGTSGHD